LPQAHEKRGGETDLLPHIKEGGKKKERERELPQELRAAKKGRLNPSQAQKCTQKERGGPEKKKKRGTMARVTIA